jgi:hypothetical protein
MAETYLGVVRRVHHNAEDNHETEDDSEKEDIYNPEDNFKTGFWLSSSDGGAGTVFGDNQAGLGWVHVPLTAVSTVPQVNYDEVN